MLISGNISIDSLFLVQDGSELLLGLNVTIFSKNQIVNHCALDSVGVVLKSMRKDTRQVNLCRSQLSLLLDFVLFCLF